MSVLHRVVRGALKPLTLAQAFSSASGALGMVIAAWIMVPAEFTQFALFTLIGSLAVGGSFAGLIQPAFINQRREDKSFVPWRYVTLPAAAASVVFPLFASVLGVRNFSDLLLLSVSAALPIYYSWMRYRAIGCSRRWTVAQADFLRLGVTAAAVAFPRLASDSVALQTYFAAATSLPMLFIAIKLPRISEWTPYHHYRHAAAWQLGDWMLGTTLISLPLLLLGGASPSPLIGGIRLAQSLLGPLNLAFAAATTNLIADGVTRAEMTADHSVISRGTSLGRLLTGLSFVVVVGVIAFFYITKISFRGVSSLDLIIGLALVGASSITSASAGVRAVILRLLGRQARATLGRGITAILTFGAFAVGYYWYGVDVSLIAGFITLTLTLPVVFICLARKVYKASSQVEAPIPRELQYD
jgi:hypothetical protein